MFIETTTKKLLRFNLNDPEDLREYNRVIQNPKIKVVDKQILQQSESHFEKDYSTTTTHHIAYLEIEETDL